MIESPENLNILVIDQMVAHFDFIKSKYSQVENKRIILNSTFKFESLVEFVEINNIKIAITFVYGKKEMYKILPLLGVDVKVILCADESNLWWLSDALPRISLIDISLPKEELFIAIDEIVQEFWDVDSDKKNLESNS
jgi:hypothetical protein